MSGSAAGKYEKKGIEACRHCDDIPESVYPDKYTYAHSEQYDGAGKMAQWMHGEIKAFIDKLNAGE